MRRLTASHILSDRAHCIAMRATDVSMKRTIGFDDTRAPRGAHPELGRAMLAAKRTAFEEVIE
jgi:hypothetical protein